MRINNREINIWQNTKKKKLNIKFPEFIISKRRVIGGRIDVSDDNEDIERGN